MDAGTTRTVGQPVNLGATSLNTTIQQIIEERLDQVIQVKVDKEEEKRFRQFRWVVILVGLIGLGTFGTLANYLIQEAVDRRAGNVKQSLDMLRVNMLALKLDISTSFSLEDSNAVMLLLHKIAKNEEARELPDFPATLEKVIKAFVSADRGANVDELFDLYHDQILASSSLVRTLLHHYGQEIVGRMSVPAQQNEDKALKNFESLERLAVSYEVPERALYYRILYEYSAQLAHARPRVLELIERVGYLNQADLSSFVIQLLDHSRATNWQKDPTVQGRAVETAVRRFMKDYAGDLSKVIDIPASRFEAWAQSGVGREEAERVGESARRASDGAD